MLNYSRRPVLHPKDTLPAKSEVSTFIVDMMAAIRTLTALPDIHERLTWKFIKSLPSGYHRIDIVADTYQDPSIKSAERSERGNAKKISSNLPNPRSPETSATF